MKKVISEDEEKPVEKGVFKPKTTPQENKISGEKEAINSIIELLPPKTKIRVELVLRTYLGLKIPSIDTIPETLPNIPNAVSAISSTKVSDLHGLYAAWLAYTRDKLKYVSAISTVLIKDVDIIYRKRLISVEGKTLEARKQEAKSGVDYIEAEEVLSVVTSLKAMLEFEVETLDKQMMSMRSELRRRENNMNF